jgi:hypothetical protein
MEENMKNPNQFEQVNILNQPVNLTIPQIFQIMHNGRTYNDAKVCLHISGGVRWVCIRKSRFDSFESAINFLREDGRSILAPELRPAYFKKMGMLDAMKKAEAELTELAVAA